MIAAAPTAMKIPRITSAMTMPIRSAVCWYCRGTCSLAMMMMKMKRLSTESEYSVSQPAKNSPPYCAPAKYQTPIPNSDRRADVEHQVAETSGWTARAAGGR